MHSPSPTPNPPQPPTHLRGRGLAWPDGVFWYHGYFSLWQRSSAIRRSQVLKRASFWQQTINYIFYIVFVLNAFITGLGVPMRMVDGDGMGENTGTRPLGLNATIYNGLL